MYCYMQVVLLLVVWLTSPSLAGEAARHKSPLTIHHLGVLSNVSPQTHLVVRGRLKVTIVKLTTLSLVEGLGAVVDSTTRLVDRKLGHLSEGPAKRIGRQLHDLARKFKLTCNTISGLSDNVYANQSTLDQLHYNMETAINIGMLNSDINNDRRALPSQGSSRRTKRGFFNGGGSLLNSLFGTATEAQVSNLENKFTEDIVPIKDALLSVNTDVIEINENLSGLSDSLTAIYIDSRKLSSEIDNLERIIVVEEIITHLMTVTQFLFDKATNWQVTLNELRSGQMPHILSYKQMRSIIHEGEERFTGLRFPVTVSTANYTHTYGLLEVSSVLEPQHIDIYFPFVDNEEFTEIRVKPFILKLENNNTAIIRDLPFNFLYNSEHYFSNCQCTETSLRSVRLCSPLTRIYNFKHNNNYPCVANIIFKNNTDNCLIQKKEIDDIFSTSMAEEWFIYVPLPITGSIQCHDRKLSSILRLYGFYRIPFNCQFSTPSFSLPYVHSSKITLNMKTFEKLEVEQFNSSNSNIFDSHNSTLHRLQSLQKRIDASKEHIRTLHQDYSSKNRIIISVSIGTVIVSVLVGILIAVYAFKRIYDRMRTSTHPSTSHGTHRNVEGPVDHVYEDIELPTVPCNVVAVQ